MFDSDQWDLGDEIVRGVGVILMIAFGAILFRFLVVGTLLREVTP